MSNSQGADEDLWAGISDDDFAHLVTDIEDIPRSAPLKTMRRGHLWVSDLASQMWCEQKLVYNFTMPVEVVKEPECVSIGKSIHLARELAVQDSIPVKTNSKEDRFAVKLINMLVMVKSFHHNTPSLREIPIFGIPFDSGVFITGVIDELRGDVNAFELDVVELKTRMRKCLPAASTSAGYKFQIMLYKTMLEDLIKGKVKKEDVVKHLGLKLDQKLGDDVMKALNGTHGQKNLDSLLEETLNAIQTLPCQNRLFIEYCAQEDSQIFHMEQVEYDELWLKSKCQDFFEFWTGKRLPVGVDVSEAWKCNYCDFANVCEWRMKQNLELQIRNHSW